MNILDAIAAALPLIYGLEGCELEAYLDTIAKPPVWTIGYGTTRVAGKPVCQGMTCTRLEANEWAVDDLSDMASAILSHIHVVVSDGQFAACLSLAYNIGVAGFERSTVLEALNQRLYYRAADRFLQYDHAGGAQVDGLFQRRKRERAVFLSGTAPAPRIPSAGQVPLRPAESDADKLNEAELASLALHDDGIL